MTFRLSTLLALLRSPLPENDLAQDPFDVAAERGRSMFDSRHRFVLSYQWSLPFLQHSSNWYGKILGNWQLNGIFTAMSGGPFTVFDSNDVSLQGQAPEITGFLREPTQSDWKPQLRPAHAPGMVQRNHLPEIAT